MNKHTYIRDVSVMQRSLVNRVKKHGLRRTAREVGMAHTTLAGYVTVPTNIPPFAMATLAELFGAQLVLEIRKPSLWTPISKMDLLKA